MGFQHPIDQYEAAEILLKYVYSGVLGSTDKKAICYALLRTTDSTFVYSAAIEPLEGPLSSLDRYEITINRRTRELSTPAKIEITNEDMQKAILAATGQTMTSSCRFIDGSLSTSYKVTTKQHAVCVVQLRHHGNVASMDALMKFTRAKNKPGIIPIPAVYSIPGEAEHQQAAGFGRQITQFMPGIIAGEVYSRMSHANKLEFVRKMALAWQAFWDTIPKWKTQRESQAAKGFLEWFRFAGFMQPVYCSNEMSKAEKVKFWTENRRVVEGMLRKYGDGKSNNEV